MALSAKYSPWPPHFARLVPLDDAGSYYGGYEIHGLPKNQRVFIGYGREVPGGGPYKTIEASEFVPELGYAVEFSAMCSLADADAVRFALDELEILRGKAARRRSPSDLMNRLLSECCEGEA